MEFFEIFLTKWAAVASVRTMPAVCSEIGRSASLLRRCLKVNAVLYVGSYLGAAATVLEPRVVYMLNGVSIALFGQNVCADDYIDVDVFCYLEVVLLRCAVLGSAKDRFQYIAGMAFEAVAAQEASSKLDGDDPYDTDLSSEQEADVCAISHRDYKTDGLSNNNVIEIIRYYKLEITPNLLKCIIIDNYALFDVLFPAVARIALEHISCLIDLVNIADTMRKRGPLRAGTVQLSLLYAHKLLLTMQGSIANFSGTQESLPSLICGFPVEHDKLLEDAQKYPKLKQFLVFDLLMATLECYTQKRHEQLLLFMTERIANLIKEQAKAYSDVSEPYFGRCKQCAAELNSQAIPTNYYAFVGAELNVRSSVESNRDFSNERLDTGIVHLFCAFFGVFALEGVAVYEQSGAQLVEELMLRYSLACRYGVVSRAMLTDAVHSKGIRMLEICKKAYQGAPESTTTYLLLGEFFGSYADQIDRFRRYTCDTTAALAYYAREYLQYSNWIKFYHLLDCFKQFCVDRQRLYSSVLDALKDT